MRQKQPERNIVLDCNLQEFSLIAGAIGNVMVDLASISDKDEMKAIFLGFVVSHHREFDEFAHRLQRMMIAMGCKR